MKRGEPLKRGKGLVRKTPLRGRPAPLTRSEGLARGNGALRGSRPQKAPKRAERNKRAPKRWREGRERVCAVADCKRRSGLHPHHVIYAQHVEDAGGDVWDPRNRLMVCEDHHVAHHDSVSGPRISLRDVPDRVYAFAVEVLGAPAAYEYLRRRYVDPDERLALLIGAA